MKQLPEFRCIFCRELISRDNKPEHILQNALGGRLTTKSVLCGKCNQEFGVGPDQDLADSVAFIRNICNLPAGDGHAPPPLNGFEADGQKFRLDPGMQVKPYAKKPMDVHFDDDDINVRIQAYSAAHADRLVEGAARKIAKKLGYFQPEAIAAIKEDILKDRKSTFQPAPRIHQSIQFGKGESQQAKAKACLVFWAHCVGGEELLDDRYLAARRFARLGETPEDRERLIKVDTRPIPPTPEEFGTNPNLIWVGSDADGRVYGYFRLYGAVGWRVLLCEAGGPPNERYSLISNPLANQSWKVSSGEDAFLSTEWVFSEWDSWPPEFEKISERLQPLMEHSRMISQQVMLENLFESGLTKAGCKEGDVPNEEQVAAFSSHVGRALAAYLLKKEIPEE